jgi:hypothetical protein
LEAVDPKRKPSKLAVLSFPSEGTYFRALSYHLQTFYIYIKPRGRRKGREVVAFSEVFWILAGARAEERESSRAFLLRFNIFFNVRVHTKCSSLLQQATEKEKEKKKKKRKKQSPKAATPN